MAQMHLNCLNPDTPDYPIYPIMQRETLTRKITRSAKHSNMGGYINVKNRDTQTLGISLVNSRIGWSNPLIGVIGVLTIKKLTALLALAGKDLFEYEVQSKLGKPWTFDNSLLYGHNETSGELKLDVTKIRKLAGDAMECRKFQFKANDFREAA